MTDVMRERGAVVNSAAQMISSGEVNLDTMPELILRIITEGMWRQRAIPQQKWKLSPEFATFEEFVITGPWDGLGTSIRALKDVCVRSPEARDAIDEATRRPAHVHADVSNIHVRPAGTTMDAALRRLRKDRPDLHKRVLAGELKPNAAMVQAGFRPRALTVRPDDPASVARSLRRHMSAADIARLVELLGVESGP